MQNNFDLVLNSGYDGARKDGAAMAERPRRQIDNKRYMIYPPQEIHPVLGNPSTSVWNEALVAWAHEIERATAENARTFTPEEWDAMLAALDIVTRTPSVARPRALGATLALELNSGGLDTLADKVGRLDNLHAWALLYAIRDRANRYKVKDGTEWWTVEYRRDHPKDSPRTWTRRGE
jgi:hypothetical protein